MHGRDDARVLTECSTRGRVGRFLTCRRRTILAANSLMKFSTRSYVVPRRGIGPAPETKTRAPGSVGRQQAAPLKERRRDSRRRAAGSGALEKRRAPDRGVRRTAAPLKKRRGPGGVVRQKGLCSTRERIGRFLTCRRRTILAANSLMKFSARSYVVPRRRIGPAPEAKTGRPGDDRGQASERARCGLASAPDAAGERRVLAGEAS